MMALKRTPTFTPIIEIIEPPRPVDTPTETLSPTTTIIPQVEILPDPAGYAFAPFQKNLDQPPYLAHAGDDSGRVFILLKNGQVLVTQDDALSPQLFLDIRKRVDGSPSERSLLFKRFTIF